MAPVYYLPAVVQYVQVGGQPRRYASLGPPFVGGIFKTDASALHFNGGFWGLAPIMGVLGVTPNHNLSLIYNE